MTTNKMNFSMDWSWSDMCGEDNFIIWDKEKRDFSHCFETLCLQIPTLVLLCVISSYFYGYPAKQLVRGSNQIFVIGIRSKFALLLALLPIIESCILIIENPRALHYVDFLLKGIQTITWAVHFGYCLLLKSSLTRHIRGPFLTVWCFVLVFISSCIQLRSSILNYNHRIFITKIDLVSTSVMLVCLGIYLITLIPKKLDGSASINSQERTPLLINSHSIYSNFREDLDPYNLGIAQEDSNWFSKLFFYWVNPLMKKGVEKKLNSADDLFEIPYYLSTNQISMKIKTTLNQEQSFGDIPYNLRPRSLFNALHKCFGWQFYGIGILKFIGDISGFFGPMLLHGLVTFIEDKHEDIKYGYMYAAGLFASTIIGAFCNAHFNFQMSVVGLKIRAALISAIYHKTISLNSVGLSQFSLGSIVNFMSTDTDRIVNSCPSFHAFWSIPFQIAVTLYLLYVQVGLAFLAGVAFSIILIPINKCVASKIGELSTKLMTAKDNRVKVMSEILKGIRVLKYHVWEEHFLRKIGKLRDIELKYLKGRKYLDALCVYFWATTPVLISILTFSTYALLGNKLNAAKVFTSIALLNMLIAPLNAFPWVLNGLTEAWVSLKRVQKFLNVSNNDLRTYYSEIEDRSHSVKLEGANFNWKTEEVDERLRFKLKNINFKATQGQLIGVIGQVGCGKSSLLYALLAEMEKTSGLISVENLEKGFGYVAQQPWLQRGTVRDNILFGNVYQHEKYLSILEACCLDKDIKTFSDGDQTGIGEAGVTLSGGQRARIALARAVYLDKPVYFIDDILSAVDPQVAKKIFFKCILGLLKTKTRIFCTHHRKFLQNADWIIVLENGQIKMQGKPEEVLDACEQFIKLEPDSSNVQEITSELSRRQSSYNLTSNDNVLSEEERETGSVSYSVYKSYWSAIGHILSIAILLSLLFMQISRNLTDWWLSYWVTHDLSHHNSTTFTSIIIGDELIDLVQNKTPVLRSSNYVLQSSIIETEEVTFYLTIYGSIAGLNTIFTLFRAFLFAYGGVHAATSVHKKLLKSVVRAKVRFFDITSIGRILNRFSSDTYTVDDSLPFILNILLAQFFGLMGSVIITIYGFPWLSVVLIFLLPFYHWLQFYYRLTSRELKRISSVNLSPVYSHFNETLQGLTTIRAFRATKWFEIKNEINVENSQKSQFSSQAAAQWLNLRLQFIGVILVGGVGLIAVIQHHFNSNVDPGLLGLSISYALSVTGLLGGLVNAFTETEKEMIAVERCQQYIQNIEPEISSEIIPTPYGWPSQGVIIFNCVVMKYRDSLAPSLNNVSFQTLPFEKIGIVGRTGAGKSSIFSALFRLTELQRGQILVDSVNIAHIGLRSLRSRIAVIPQEPFLFSGSVKENVDPLGEYSDREIWNALKRCHIENIVTEIGGLDADVGESGKLFSVGQQQLLCLTRAVLHNAKILCIDEATANVDRETDEKIQETIKTSFFQSTVLTIAHRVQTVLESDRVLVMGNGEVLEFDTPDSLLQDTNSYFYNMVYEN